MKWKPIWRLTMIGAAMALSAGIAAGGLAASQSHEARIRTCTGKRDANPQGTLRGYQRA